MSKQDISFIFGAGAEADYHLPLGDKFTEETILSKRTKMYMELKYFYSNRLIDGYVKQYKQEYLFSKSSNAFYEIIYRAVKQCYEDSAYKEIDYDTKELFKYLSLSSRPSSKTKSAFKTNVVEKMYKFLISDLDNYSPNKHYKYKSLIDSITYYGSVEKDFSSVIDPNGAGLKQFWRFANYLWSAFFSILLPLLDNSNLFTTKPYYEQYKCNRYRAVLQNLKDVVSFIYSSEYLDETRNIGYYNKIANKFNGRIYNVITTNYTPFVKSIFKDAAFLAGELSNFEYPHHLEVKDITKSRFSPKAFVFPFLLTQAPVKPIIEPKQISQYSKMNTILNNSKYLVILGYNINNNDNHINSYIRKFVMRNKTQLIFCKFSESELSDAQINQEYNNIRKKLYIDSKRNNIHILPFSGESESLCNQLEVLINSLRKF